MGMEQVFRILWARKMIIIICVCLTVGAATAISLSLSKSYTAETTMVLAVSGSDQVTGGIPDQILKAGYMQTQVDILASRNVATRVVENLGLEDSEQLRRLLSQPSLLDEIMDSLGISSLLEEFSEKSGDGDTTSESGENAEASNSDSLYKRLLVDYMIENATVTPSREGKTITLTFVGPSPRMAAMIADGFARAYIQANLALRVQPAQQNAIWFNERIQALRTNWAESQRRLADIKRKAQIVSTDGRLDLETKRLELLTQQLLTARAETVGVVSRQEQLQADLQNGSIATSSFPEVLNNNLIQKYKVDLVNAEALLAELQQKLDKNHPHYQRAIKTIAKIKQDIAAEVKNVIQGMSSSVRVARQKEAELGAELERQKEKVLDLRQDYDQISVVEQEVESNKQAFEDALSRYEQADLEAQATQTNISILNVAVPPKNHSSPKTRLNVMIAFLVGMILGTGVAILQEMNDRRVRSPADVEDSLDIPVIGEIHRGTASKRKTRPVAAASAA